MLCELLRRGGIQRGHSPPDQILRQRLGGFFLRPRQHQTAQPPLERILQIIHQQIQIARPHRQLPGGDIVQLLQRNIPARMGKSIQQNRAARLHFLQQRCIIQHILGQPAAQLPLFQQQTNILLQLPMRRARPVARFGPFGHKQQRSLPIIKQGGGLLINQRNIFVQRSGHAAAPQPIHIRQQIFFGSGGCFAAQRLGQLLNLTGERVRIVIHDLRRRRNGHAFQRLGDEIKIGQRVHRVAPQLQPHRRGKIRRVHIHNAAPHRKLTGTLDLVAPLVSGCRQCGGQIGHRQRLPLGQSQRTGAQHRGRQRKLHRRVDTGNHAIVVPRRHLRQHAQPQLLILARGGFHPLQRQIARRQKQRRAPQRRQILAKAGRLRFVRHHHHSGVSGHGAQRVNGQHLVDMPQSGHAHRQLPVLHIAAKRGKFRLFL